MEIEKGQLGRKMFLFYGFFMRECMGNNFGEKGIFQKYLNNTKIVNGRQQIIWKVGQL